MRACGGGRYGDDPDPDPHPGDLRLDLIVAQDCQPVDLLPDVLLVAVEDSRDVERRRHETAIAHDGATQVPESSQRDVPLPIELEDATDRFRQEAGVVPFSLLAEPSEVGKVAPDLRRRHPDVIRQLVG